jgi:hypothetical protein
VLRDHWYDLIKGPFGSIKLLALAGAVVAIAGIALSVAFPILLPYGAGLFAAYLVLIAVLGLHLLTRLVARVHDTHAAVTLYANLPVAGHIQGGLFMDGAAANASLMLFLNKCLTICRPKRVLELGSGQTTKLLAHYYHENPGVEVCTLEHNASWVKSLRPLLTKEGRCLDYRHAPLTDREFVCRGTGERIHTPWYTVPPEFKRQQFDLILVDGPDTGHGAPYTREGVLEYLPDILGSSFVVIFDDAERAEEMRLASAFERILRALNIGFVHFQIEAIKTQAVFCSSDLAYLRSV